MRILITGSRTWENRKTIEAAIGWHASRAILRGESVTVVSGNCPLGADHMAEMIAEAMGLRVELHPADWKTHGKRAGFIRNAEMVNLGADVCLAFIRDGSKGASMTRDLAIKAGIRTQVFEETS